MNDTETHEFELIKLGDVKTETKGEFGMGDDMGPDPFRLIP